MLRMRQICLVARDLRAAEADLTAVLGLEVCHRDPGVGRFGLENVLLPVGNDFLEVVAPVREGTAAGRYLERRGGDGGYMVILQCDDVAAARRRVAELGIRVVWEGGPPGESDGIQLHPKDVPGAILELRWNAGGEDPAGPWWPAGPDWQRARRTDVVRALRAAELQSPDPAALARRWGQVLDRPVTADAAGRPQIPLDGAVLRFVPDADGRGEGLGGLDVEAEDRERLLAAARARGCPVDDDVVTLCGVRFRLV